MQTAIGSPTASAILFFFLIVAITLGITYWAAKRTRSTKEFYAAGRTRQRACRTASRSPATT